MTEQAQQEAPLSADESLAVCRKLREQLNGGPLTAREAGRRRRIRHDRERRRTGGSR